MGPPFNQLSPPAPTFTEYDITDQGGRVFIVTGSTSGIGYELAKMIYARNGTVYIAARSKEKIKAAIDTIRADAKTKTGQLVPLKLDLSDLPSIQASAREFLNKENRLDVIFHNAGVMTPPPGSKTKLGHDLEMTTNCLGPFLFNRCLEDILRATASAAHEARVIWLTSMISASVPTGGMVMNKDSEPAVLKNKMENYMQSKVGNLYLGIETARQMGKDGILSVSVNPGLLKTELQRHLPAVPRAIMGLIFKEPKFGAYSELFAGFSPKITQGKNGAFIIPWGRFGPIPDHIQAGIKEGKPAQFYEWCDRTTRAYQ